MSSTVSNLIFLMKKVENSCQVCQDSNCTIYWEDVFAIPNFGQPCTVDSAKQWIMENGKPGDEYRIIDATAHTGDAAASLETVALVGRSPRRFWLVRLEEEVIKVIKDI